MVEIFFNKLANYCQVTSTDMPNYYYTANNKILVGLQVNYFVNSTYNY